MMCVWCPRLLRGGAAGPSNGTGPFASVASGGNAVLPAGELGARSDIGPP